MIVCAACNQRFAESAPVFKHPCPGRGGRSLNEIMELSAIAYAAETNTKPAEVPLDGYIAVNMQQAELIDELVGALKKGELFARTLDHAERDMRIQCLVELQLWRYEVSDLIKKAEAKKP